MSQSHNEYPLLFSPLQVGPITLRNRIVNSAHQTGFAQDLKYSDQLIEYHRERARGGAALIVSQAMSVTGEYLDLHNSNDSVIPGYKEVAHAVQEHGAHYSAELYHPGSQGWYTGPEAEVYVAPSSVAASYLGGRWRVAHELTETEILGIVDAFAAAANRCRQGGLSGIELHFAHGNLVEQFMSPRTNLRTDDWGGSLENRLRFAQLITSAVREAAGPELAVGARMTAAGMDAGDLNDLDMAEIIGTVCSWGDLDYVSLTMGHYSDALNTARNVPNMTFRPGLWQKHGQLIKSIVDVPVFLVGRINHPQTAEELLAADACDAVVMARALIADPHLPEKARTGRTEDIRPCVGAMNCMDSLEKGGGIKCIHNPRVGHELDLAEEVAPAAGGKKVLVIGGGPAGLEAARVAAIRGHQVTLIDKESKLGGQVTPAAKTPGRGELSTIIEWLESQCRKHGVDIQTNQVATAELIAQQAADLVVVATGASYPKKPSFGYDAVSGKLDSVSRDLNMLGLDDVLAGALPHGNVVVYDAVADWPGFNAARLLAESGCQVRYLTPEQYPGYSLEVSNWRLEYQALTDLNVTFHPVTQVVGSNPGELIIRTGFSRNTEKMTDIDAVVWIDPPSPNTSVAELVSATDAHVLTIGDAYAPRSVEQAIYEARIKLLKF